MSELSLYWDIENLINWPQQVDEDYYDEDRYSNHKSPSQTISDLPLYRDPHNITEWPSNVDQDYYDEDRYSSLSSSSSSAETMVPELNFYEDFHNIPNWSCNVDEDYYDDDRSSPLSASLPADMMPDLLPIYQDPNNILLRVSDVEDDYDEGRYINLGPSVTETMPELPSYQDLYDTVD